MRTDAVAETERVCLVWSVAGPGDDEISACTLVRHSPLFGPVVRTYTRDLIDGRVGKPVFSDDLEFILAELHSHATDLDWHGLAVPLRIARELGVVSEMPFDIDVA